MSIGEESDFFFPLALGSEGEPFPMQEAQALTLSAACQPVFPLRHLPSDPRAAPGGPFCHQRLKWNLPLGALRECPGGSALRSGGGHASEGSALLPGHLCPWRRPASQVRGRRMRSASRARGVGAWGTGRWLRTSGGHRELRDPPRAPLLLPLGSIRGSRASLTPHPHVWRSGTGQARLRRGSDAAPRPRRRLPVPSTQRRLLRLRPGRVPGAPRPTNRPSHVAARPPAQPVARPR